MPKGGLHHLHTTAAPAVEFYLKLTYNDSVYFNEREKMFKVAPVRIIAFIFAYFRKDWMRMGSFNALK